MVVHGCLQGGVVSAAQFLSDHTTEYAGKNALMRYFRHRENTVIDPASDAQDRAQHHAA